MHAFPSEVDMISSRKEESACHCTNCILSHFHQVRIGLQEKGIQAGKFSSHEKHFKIFQTLHVLTYCMPCVYIYFLAVNCLSNPGNKSRPGVEVSKQYVYLECSNALLSPIDK